MDYCRQVHTQLVLYMREALNVCIKLQAFTKQNQDAFQGEDDQMIIQVIAKREIIIDQLVKLEYKIDLILDQVDDYCNGNALPHDVEALRNRIVEISSDILSMDMKAAKYISMKVQKYKDETLKARNKKNLSAYIKTNLMSKSFGSYDLKQ